MLEFAVQIAREAGEILMAGYGQVARSQVSYKGWRNLVTDIDLAAEELLARRIAERFPDHGILGEERVRKEARDPEEHCWVIDPLDGTTNFVHAHPVFCVSVGLTRRGDGIAGVVHAPYLEETIAAASGAGATLNGITCRVSEEGEIRGSLLASGFAYRQDESANTNLENWAELSLVARGLRRCGAAALDLAYVACGRYEGFWELHLSPWDVCAGAVLVAEAGGVVTDFRGGDGWKSGREVLASNGLVHEAIRSRLRGDPA